MTDLGQKLLAKMDRGETTLGVLVVSPSIELVEILAYVGFDYIFVDQMFGRVDWKDLGEMALAGENLGMAVIGRVENDPWYGMGDRSTSAHVARVMGVGCHGVKINIADVEQARRSLGAAAGWHRKLHLVQFRAEGFAEFEETAGSALVIPSIESDEGIAHVDELLELEGLKVFGLALTDTSRMLGHPGEYEHPEVWQFVDRVTTRAQELGVHVCGGTGYAYRTPKEISDRVGRLVDHGIRMVFLQTAEFLVQMATSQLLEQIRDSLGTIKANAPGSIQ